MVHGVSEAMSLERWVGECWGGVVPEPSVSHSQAWTLPETREAIHRF